jgi:CRP-like cAMP-binding protein
MSHAPHPQSENHILSRLPPEDYERLRPHLERVELSNGQILQQAGGLIEHSYFPLKSMISLVSHTADGESVEVGVTGYEGAVNISIALGVDKSPYELLVQFPDGAMRLRARVMREEFGRGGALHDLLLRYMQGLLLQTSQVAACNAKHNVVERLARWILMSEDRCRSDDLPFTHEFLSVMLGVRRAGVTEAAIVLQAEGYINYRRGHIKITDRAGLEAFACSCYPVIKAEFDLLTG